MQILQIFEYVLFGYATILMVIGPILNVLCSITCFATNLNKYPSFIYLGVIAIADSIALINGQLKAVLATAFKLYPFDDNVWGLKIWLWSTLISTEAASLLMILMTTERILTLKIQMWRKRYFSTKKAVISVMIVFGYLLGLNSSVFIAGLANDTNMTINERMMNTGLGRIFQPVYGFHFALIPIPVLIIENAYLIYITISKSGNIERSEEASKKRRSISISVLLVTCLFIILNTPIAIVIAFFIQVYDPTNPNFLVYLFAVALQSTFESISFLTLYKFNNLFKSEFHGLFKRNKQYFSNFATSGVRTN